MTQQVQQIMPSWSLRVPRSKIQRFYEMSSSGILDEELIDDVGISLYARCESMIEVKDAKRGTVKCPSCRASIERQQPLSNNDRFKCMDCSWTCDWPTYRKHYKGTLLNAGQIEKQIRAFIRSYKGAKDYRQKIVLIDTLIHLIHDEIGGGNKPGAHAFIEGAISDVAAFSDRLTYGSAIPEDVGARREQWRNRVRTSKSFWSDQLQTEDDSS